MATHEVIPAPGAPAPSPSMLDLVRLAKVPRFPPGGIDLYRQIAQLTELTPDQELLVASCGLGLTLEYFVREWGVHGSGVEEDPVLVDRTESRLQEAGLIDQVHVQRGSMADLPYRDGVFDVAIGEIGLSARAEPRQAVRELVRVVRPGGFVVLVQLVWKAPARPDRQLVLSRHLGARPLMLVELRQVLREAGVEQLHTESWSDGATAYRAKGGKPFPDFAELFTLREKFGILQRAGGRWGWRGVFSALAREREVHQLLTRERILGLDLILGRRGTTDVAWEEAEGCSAETLLDHRSHPPSEEPHLQTLDLPLFARSGVR